MVQQRHSSLHGRPERLSALLDDELPEWEARQALEEAKADPEAWARLTAQQAALQGLPEADLLSGIQQELDEADAALAQQRSRDSRVRKTHWAGFVQGAVAAGVVAALTIGFWPTPDPVGEALDAPDSAALTAPAAGSASPEVQDYWTQHARYATYGRGARWDEVERSESAL